MFWSFTKLDESESTLTVNRTPFSLTTIRVEYTSEKKLVDIRTSSIPIRIESQ